MAQPAVLEGGGGTWTPGRVAPVAGEGKERHERLEPGARCHCVPASLELIVASTANVVGLWRPQEAGRIAVPGIAQPEVVRDIGVEGCTSRRFCSPLGKAGGSEEPWVVEAALERSVVRGIRSVGLCADPL